MVRGERRLWPYLLGVLSMGGSRKGRYVRVWAESWDPARGLPTAANPRNGFATANDAEIGAGVKWEEGDDALGNIRRGFVSIGLVLE